MVGPLHEHPPGDAPGGDPADADQARRTPRGLILFTVYLALYGAFVFLNAFRPVSMEATPILRINLAIVYGMCLIAGAFVLALIYAWLARDRPR